MAGTHRPLFRFSILNAVLLMTIAAMSVALWRLYTEIRPLREEVTRLRNEAGYLVIDDANRDCVHATRVDTENPLFWKWKVYLPEDRDYWLGAYVGEMPPKGELPNKPGPVSNKANYRRGRDDEQFVKISVIRDVNGELVLRQQLGGIGTKTPLNVEQERILAGGSTSNGRGPSVGFNGTSRASEDEPLVLLNQQRWGPDDKLGIDGEPRGMIVWIEPVEHSDNE